MLRSSEETVVKKTNKERKKLMNLDTPGEAQGGVNDVDLPPHLINTRYASKQKPDGGKTG